MLELFHTPIIVLHVIVCVMLMLVVLIQPGKSGGLGAALGGSGAQQIFGGRGAGNFLTRTTWIAASVFFLTSITLAYVSTSTGDSLEDLAADVQPIKTPAEAPVEPPPAAAAPEGTAPAAPADREAASEAPATDPTAPSDQPSEPGTAPAQP